MTIKITPENMASELVSRTKPKDVENRELVILDMYAKVEGKPILDESGTRFRKDSAPQLALLCVIECIQKGVNNIRDLRDNLVFVRKENGFKYDLDAGYVRYAIANNPEIFELYNDDTVEIAKLPEIKKSINITNTYVKKCRDNVMISRESRRRVAIEEANGSK